MRVFTTYRKYMCLGIISSVAVPYLDHPRPLAFAHRGGAAHQPENSWPAFEYAVQLGYAYLETDARSTADGKLIAFHDATLDRVTDRTGQVGRLTWQAGVRGADRRLRADPAARGPDRHVP